jgi:3-dehydroquinate dehydratase/shikimate dehydrogenase
MTTPPQIASHLLRSRIGKICVAITGGSADEMLAKAAEVLKETTFLEFRLDYLPKPAASLSAFRQFLSDHTECTAVATCRCEPFGGHFKGSNAEAADILLKAADSGFHLVDIELESAEKLPKVTLEKLQLSPAVVMVSHHDFQATRDLDAILERARKFKPGFIKIVPTAQKLADNLTLMHFLERTEDATNCPVVGICMGEAGIISRVLGLRAGSAFTFAAATAGEETAPGQIAARTLLETYRIDAVDAATKVYGVAGNPIKSSLSPVMMNTAFRRETVNAVFLALQTSKADDLFKLVREIPVQGLSVTMPLKRDIMPMLERTDALSTKIGAVNTVFRAQDGKFYGFNTDVSGIVVPLERRLTLKGAKVLVLGAGGVARAAVFGLRDKGAEVHILNRTPESAQKLAREAGAKTIKRDAVAKAAFDVVINATPVGMAGNKTAALLGPEDLTCKLVFDLVYNPLETPLLTAARAKGIAVIQGVEMFVQQGARQFEIWTGKPAPEEEMLRVVLHSLRTAAEAAGEPTPPMPALVRIETAAAAAASAARAAAIAAEAPPPVAAPPPAPVKAVAKAPVKTAKLAAPVTPPVAAPVASAPVKPAVSKTIAPAAKKAVAAKGASATPKAVTKKTVPATKKAAPAKPIAKAPAAKKPVAKAASKKASANAPVKKAAKAPAKAKRR